VRAARARHPADASAFRSSRGSRAMIVLALVGGAWLACGQVQAALRAYRATAVTDPTFARGFDPEIRFSVYLARLNDDEQGRCLPENYVPTTFYCGFIGTEVVGRLTLRPSAERATARDWRQHRLHRRTGISSARGRHRNAAARAAARKTTRPRPRPHHLR
jgi:hypothetical protein